MDTVEESFGSRFLQNIERELDGRTIDYLIVNRTGARPLVIGADAAPRLPRHADRRQRQDHSRCSQATTASPTTRWRSRRATRSTWAEASRSRSTSHRWCTGPEVMVSYCPEHRTLFSADAFGTFGTLDGGITDSQVRLDHYWDESAPLLRPASWANTACRCRRRWLKLGTLPIETICSDTRPRMAARNSARARHLRPPEPLRGRGGAWCWPTARCTATRSSSPTKSPARWPRRA